MAMRCKNCGEDWKRTALLCLLVDFGAQARDPNHCHESKDHEHNWIDPDGDAKRQDNLEVLK